MALADIYLVAEELRAAFADERRAIAALDSDRLELLADHKRRCAARLADVVGTDRSPEVKRLLAAVRAEAQANAALAAIAAEAVRGILGHPTTGIYDRRARSLKESNPVRIIATL